MCPRRQKGAGREREGDEWPNASQTSGNRRGEAVGVGTIPHKFQCNPRLTRLDVVFTGFYFAAIAGALNQNADTASSWDALFEARNRAGVDRIQFALAGMNAHTNHDLELPRFHLTRWVDCSQLFVVITKVKTRKHEVPKRTVGEVSHPVTRQTAIHCDPHVNDQVRP
jgi:hypothetical protein